MRFDSAMKAAMLPAAAGPLRCRVIPRADADGSSGGGNISRRRSQRLSQRGRTRAPDVQQQLKERQARREELERRIQEEHPELRNLTEEEGDASEEEAGGDALSSLAAQEAVEAEPAAAAQAGAPRDPAMADLVQRLRQWPQQGRGQAAAAEPAYGSGGGGLAEAAVAAEEDEDEEEEEEEDEEAEAAARDSDLATVEADYIIEEELGQPLGTLPRRPLEEVEELVDESTRQSEALLAILQAGEQVEEVIAERRADIDETTLQLLAARIKAARQLEEAPEVLQGLDLLFRRLKAEVDRQQAPPELQLLDELLNILDPGGEGEAAAPAAVREQRAQEAAARLRAAFTGSLPAGADVLSVAAQLGAGPGGAELADQLLADPVDPNAFMATGTELLRGASSQERELRTWVQRQRAALERLAAADNGEMDEEAAAAAAQLAKAEAALEERAAAVLLLQRCLEVAEAVMRQLSLGG